MKSKILFLLLLGFLFVSFAEAKTDIHVNDGFEVVINTMDADLVAIDYTAIETPVIYSNYLVINVCRYIIINQKMNVSNYPIINEALSNPGKDNLTINYNYTTERTNIIKHKIPFGLRYKQVNHTII